MWRLLGAHDYGSAGHPFATVKPHLHWIAALLLGDDGGDALLKEIDALDRLIRVPDRLPELELLAFEMRFKKRVVGFAERAEQ